MTTHSAPFAVTVIVDCPACGHDKASMCTNARNGQTAFLCDSDGCLHLWVGEVVEPAACGHGFGGGASCGLPPGHDEPCAPGGT